MRLEIKFIIILLGWFFFTKPLIAQKTYPGPFKIIGKSLSTIPQEVKGIALYPLQHPNETLKFAGISLALITIDKPTTKFTQRFFNHAFDVNFKNFIPVVSGRDDYIIGGIAALYAGSVVFKYEKGQIAALAAVKATAYSVVYTHLILKSLTGRQRPHSDLNNPNFNDSPKTTNNWNFFNFHKPTLGGSQYGTAFPSYHITYAFAVARAVERTLHNTFFPYAFVITLNMMNFHGHAHWVSDMVAGAMVGHMIGTMATGGFKEKKLGKGYIKPHVSFAYNPYTLEQFPTFGLSYRF